MTTNNIKRLFVFNPLLGGVQGWVASRGILLALIAYCLLPTAYLRGQSAQDTIPYGGTPFGYSTLTYSVPNDSDSTYVRIKVSEENPLPVKAMSSSIIYLIDTLSGANDTVNIDLRTANNGRPPRTAYISFRDVNDANTDSIKIIRFSTAFNAWTSEQVGFYNSWNQVLEGTNTTAPGLIVPGQGKIKMYEPAEKLPEQYKVVWWYGSDKAGRTLPLAVKIIIE
jgi:hypothetical protein